MKTSRRKRIVKKIVSKNNDLKLNEINKNLSEKYGHMLSFEKYVNGVYYYDLWGVFRQLDDRALDYILSLGFEFIEFLPFPLRKDFQMVRLKYSGIIENNADRKEYNVSKMPLLFNVKVGKRYKVEDESRN